METPNKSIDRARNKWNHRPPYLSYAKGKSRENQRKIHGQSMDNPVKLFPETNPLMPKIPPLWDDTRCHSPLTTSMKKTQTYGASRSWPIPSSNQTRQWKMTFHDSNSIDNGFQIAMLDHVWCQIKKIPVYQVVPGTRRGGSFDKGTWLIGIHSELERSELI